MSRFSIRKMRRVTGNESRSESERMIMGMSSVWSMWACSACVDTIRPWFDKIASMSSRVDVDGIEANRIEVGFSPLTRRFRSLKTCSISVNRRSISQITNLVCIIGSRSYCNITSITDNFGHGGDFQGLLFTP